jgi:hypothetical protein
VTKIKTDLSKAIIEIANARFDGTDYIGGPTPKSALVIPLLFTASRTRLYAWLFLYRAWGFTTVGLDTAKENGPLRRAHWAFVGHCVDWEKHVPTALQTLSDKARALAPPSRQKRNVALKCDFHVDHKMVGVSDVRARSSIGVLEVAYKE